MDKGTFGYICKILRDYPQTDAYIKSRELELMYPHNTQPDNNVGGGRSNIPSIPTERMAISIADDRRLANIRANQRSVDRCLNLSDEITHKIIEELYFKEHPTLTYVGVANVVHLSPSQVKRRRQAFFELMVQELGMLQ